MTGPELDKQSSVRRVPKVAPQKLIRHDDRLAVSAWITAQNRQFSGRNEFQDWLKQPGQP